MNASGPSLPDDDVTRPVTPEVVDTLVASHREFLRFLERRVGSREVAEDLLQEAFARGLDRLGELRSEESIRAWFYRTLRNAVVDHHRRRGASQRALANLAAELSEEGTTDPALEETVCRCVSRLASTLKPEYAQALERVEVEGLSVQAFAEAAGISANNAAVRLHRARTALRQRVASACGTCAEHGCLDCSCDMGTPPPSG